MKVLYMTNIPVPYRMDFFNELGKLCELTVSFDKRINDRDWQERNHQWLKNDAKNFKTIFLGEDGSNIYKMYLKIKKIIKKENFDIVVIGEYNAPVSTLAMFYLKKKNRKFIINSDGGFINYNENKLKKMLKTFLISRGSHYITTGNNAVKYLKYYGAKGSFDLYPFTTLKSKDILNKSVSDKEKKQIKEKLNIKYDRLILSVGRFIPLKGFDSLIEASSGISENIGVYIIGGQPTEEYLQIIKDNKLKNIEFIDFVQPNKIKEYFKVADLFILPTKSDVWGLVIVEALSFGLPVITTDKCGAGVDLIEEGKNGYVVKVDDVHDLHNKIVAVMNDDEKIIKMKEYALLKMQDYTIEKEAECHSKIFDSVLKGCNKNEK